MQESDRYIAMMRCSVGSSNRNRPEKATKAKNSPYKASFMKRGAALLLTIQGAAAKFNMRGSNRKVESVM